MAYDLVDHLPDFTGKILNFTTLEGDAGYDMVEPHFEIQGGRLFVMGKTPRGASTTDWGEGCLAALAWDQVLDYTVFDSPERYELAMQKSRQDETDPDPKDD